MKKIILSLIFCVISLNCMSEQVGGSGGGATPGIGGGGTTTNACTLQGFTVGGFCSSPSNGIQAGTYQVRSLTSMVGSSDCVCVPSQCVSGYTFYSENCYKKTQTVQCSNCSNPVPENASTCARNWNDANHTYGTCYPTACVTGYHLSEQQCVSNIGDCDCSDGSNGTQCKHQWNETDNKWGECYPTDCESGYNLTEQECVPLTIIVCSEGETEDCTGSIQHSQQANKTCLNNEWGACILEKCKVHYHKKNNECEFDFKKYK